MSGNCWRRSRERAAQALRQRLLFDRTRSHAVTDLLTGLYNAPIPDASR